MVGIKGTVAKANQMCFLLSRDSITVFQNWRFQTDGGMCILKPCKLSKICCIESIKIYTYKVYITIVGFKDWLRNGHFCQNFLSITTTSMKKVLMNIMLLHFKPCSLQVLSSNIDFTWRYMFLETLKIVIVNSSNCIKCYLVCCEREGKLESKNGNALMSD